MKNKLKKIVLGVFLILMGALSIYVGIKNLNKKETKSTKNDNQEQVLTSKDKEILVMAKDLVEKELFILEEEGVKNSNSIPPHLKAKLGLKLLCFSNQTNCNKEKIEASIIEDVYNKTSLSNFKFENANVYCIPGIKENSNNKPDHFEWRYDNKTKDYVYEEIGHGYRGPGIILKKLLEETKENNLYIIKYHYVYTSNGDGEEPTINIYRNYDDAYLEKSPYKEIPMVENREQISKEVENIYNADKEFQKSLDIYTYKFELINNSLKLKEFYR